MTAFPCGHTARTWGCGGCDPDAVEFVIDDTTGQITRCVWPKCPDCGDDDGPRHQCPPEWTL